MDPRRIIKEAHRLVDMSEYERPTKGIRGRVQYVATGAIFRVGRAEAMLCGPSPNRRKSIQAGRY